MKHIFQTYKKILDIIGRWKQIIVQLFVQFKFNVYFERTKLSKNPQAWIFFFF